MYLIRIAYINDAITDFPTEYKNISFPNRDDFIINNTTFFPKMKAISDFFLDDVVVFKITDFPHN